MINEQKALSYYRAIVEKRRPEWVPSRVRLDRDIYGDAPFLGAGAAASEHNSVADWCISIYDRKGKTLSECVTPEIQVQNPTRKLAEYLSETRGGY